MEDNQEEKDKRRRILYLLLLLLLLIGSAGLNLYQYISRAHKEESMNKELVSSASLRTEMQRELDSTRSELNDYRGRTSKMDTVIQQKERELLEKAHQIEKLLKDNKITYNKFIEAKDEIDKWKYYAQKYLGQIDELSAENKRLISENKDLNEAVNKDKHNIDQLTDQNVMLNNKVSLGAQLHANNIVITGIRMRGNGKEHETNRAKQIEKVKICFDVPENHVADNGNRDIFIKITDPSGQPVVIESEGSGQFTYQNANNSYTTKDQIFYDNMPKNYCLYWSFAKDAHLHEGTYSMELFTDGYKLGEKNFTIK